MSEREGARSRHTDQLSDVNFDEYAQRQRSNDVQLQYLAPKLQAQVRREGRSGEFWADGAACSEAPKLFVPRCDRHTGVGVAVASAQGCRVSDDAAPTPFTANLQGVGGGHQTARCSAALSGRGLPDECDAERFGQ